MSLVVDPVGERGEWALLEAHGPGRASAPVGILLRERSRDRLYIKIRPEWWCWLPASEDTELWCDLAKDLEQQAQEMGAGQVLAWLESTASHTLQISTRQEIPLTTAPATLDRLYWQHVEVSHRCSAGAHQTFLFLKATAGRLFSRQLQHRLRMNSLWTQAAVAATLLLTATWTGLQSPHPRSSPPFLSMKTQELGELPLLMGVHYQPALWNLNVKVPILSPAHRSRTKRRVAATHPRKRFQIASLLVHRRAVQPIYAAPPLLDVAFESRPPALVPAALEALPIPRPYRARRNKFVRVLALVAAPFRMIAR